MGDFTLKKKNEIEGLTVHLDHTRNTNTCLFLALLKFRQEERAAKAGSSEILFRKKKRFEHFFFLQTKNL